MKGCAAACSRKENDPPTTDVQVETSLALARAKSTVGLPATLSGHRGFPTGSGTFCRCRQGQAETGFARSDFLANAERRKEINLSLFAGKRNGF